MEGAAARRTLLDENLRRGDRGNSVGAISSFTTSHKNWVDLVVDLFILHRSAAPLMRHDHQVHARKNHSFLWIFRKPGSRLPASGCRTQQAWPCRAAARAQETGDGT